MPLPAEPPHFSAEPSSSLQRQALSAALNAITKPAFMVDADARVLVSNSSARALLEEQGPDSGQRLAGHLAVALTQKLEPGVAQEVEGARVTLIVEPGLPPLYLIVERQSAPSNEARVRRASEAWGLTPRQAEILAQVLAGATNKDIATHLSCSVRTIEHHVTGILCRSGMSNRTALVSQILAGPQTA